MSEPTPVTSQDTSGTGVDPEAPVSPESVAGKDITLSDEEAAVVAAEAAAAARVYGEPRATDARRLAEAAAEGTIPADLVDTFEQLALASLQGGRARKLYRAEGEGQLNRVLGRTPAGRARKRDLAEINQALGALAGRQLQGVEVGTRTPGNHMIRLKTDGVTITLGMSVAGLTVESVAT